MAQEVFQTQLTQVADDGSEVIVYPINSKKEVITGEIPVSQEALEMPASYPEERLEETISKIKLYLQNLSNIASIARNVVDNPSENTNNLASTKATAALKLDIDNLNDALKQAQEALGTKTPIDHASEDKTYGGGTAEKYGHVRVSDKYTGFTEVDPVGAASDSVSASQKAVADTYKALNDAKAQKSHASTDGTFGISSDSLYGHTKLSDTYESAEDNSAAANGIAASQNALANAYKALNDAKSPNNHASQNTNYGIGTTLMYGHTKVSDTYKAVVENSAAANGVAASQNALGNAYKDIITITDELNSKKVIINASKPEQACLWGNVVGTYTI